MLVSDKKKKHDRISEVLDLDQLLNLSKWTVNNIETHKKSKKQNMINEVCFFIILSVFASILLTKQCLPV